MASAPIAQSADAPAKPSRISWAAIAWFGALLFLCYAPILFRMAKQWANDENMGHGFFVPIVAGYIAWKRRDLLVATPRNPSMWGLVIVVWAALQALVATLGAEIFTARLAFVMSLFGVVLFIGGKQWLKILLFPLLLLLFMIPIPQILYARLTLSLQMLASELGEILISAMGIPVIRTGNLLQLPSQTLDIAEACSGIRSLLSLGFLSLVYAYFTDNRAWMRVALLIATVPIAIFANGIRVATTGWLSEIDLKLAQGTYHEMEGYLVFVVALLALIATHRAISFAARRFGKA
ncbi:MAG: exosortase/archaeosortase family protein [Acidobacteriaceae bacterium]|nr:exosortase/archaeosortase family protein [Acidobacteriaceae bacterium]